MFVEVFRCRRALLDHRAAFALTGFCRIANALTIGEGQRLSGARTLVKKLQTRKPITGSGVDAIKGSGSSEITPG